MPHPHGLSQGQHLGATQFPHLSRPQALGLSRWSAGLVLAQRGGLTPVAVCWPLCVAAARRRGARPAAIPPAMRPTNGGPRAATSAARWLPPPWASASRCCRFRSCSRGGAMPVAWPSVRATATGAWQPHWNALLAQLAGAVPADWTVVVAPDRGL